ncbi:hypothetical protein [Arthrobacter sp. CP30]
MDVPSEMFSYLRVVRVSAQGPKSSIFRCIGFGSGGDSIRSEPGEIHTERFRDRYFQVPVTTGPIGEHEVTETMSALFTVDDRTLVLVEMSLRAHGELEGDDVAVMTCMLDIPRHQILRLTYISLPGGKLEDVDATRAH